VAKLILQASAGLVFLLALIAAALFGPAGTCDFWQAWVFLGVFAGGTIAITIDLARRDPALLARRVKAGPVAERRPAQKIVQSVASLAFAALFVIAGFDQRYGWSQIATALVVVGDGLVATGLYIVFLVFRANTFTSAVVAVEADQRLVSTGPYAVIRHPMYAGALLLLIGTPIAVGCWWGLVAVAALAAVIVWRLIDEESVLLDRLPGYTEYRRRVKHRLVPGVW
jgi:protein-S-isoprenylcysteine O-methyltransferase Ste14